MTNIPLNLKNDFRFLNPAVIVLASELSIPLFICNENLYRKVTGKR